MLFDRSAGQPGDGLFGVFGALLTGQQILYAFVQRIHLGIQFGVLAFLLTGEVAAFFSAEFNERSRFFVRFQAPFLQPLHSVIHGPSFRGGLGFSNGICEVAATGLTGVRLPAQFRSGSVAAAGRC